MAPDVSTEEALRLARAMTFKNAAAGLSHGGGKSVIFADPKMPLSDKERLIRGFAAAIADLTDYIPGPDMGTDELAMGWIKDEIGRAVGLPRELGGIPLDEIGATGFGLVAAVDVARVEIGLSLTGARVVVQGFGSVGQHAARFLAEKGRSLSLPATHTVRSPIRTGWTSMRSWPQGRRAGIDRPPARPQARHGCGDRHPMRCLDPGGTPRCHPCRQCCATADPDRR